MLLLLLFACPADEPAKDSGDTTTPADDTGACTPTAWYPDADGDGHGTGTSVEACEAPTGHAALGDDCDDTNPVIYPGAMEICDNLDDDCNGEADPGYAQYFIDGDSDGYGDPDASLWACTAPEHTSSNGDDCDDTNAEINPAAEEICGDGIDGNCDGDEVLCE